MSQEELCFTPATELAQAIRTRALSPVELMQAVLARAERLNPALNAICTPTYEPALAAARQAETALMRGERLGLLHGLPLTIKDLSLTRGLRSMGGTAMYRDRMPQIDHLHVERLR